MYWSQNFNSLANNMQSYRMTGKKFRNKLYRYLIIHPFYSVTECLECKIDKDIKYKTIFMADYLSKCVYINYVLTL